LQRQLLVFAVMLRIIVSYSCIINKIARVRNV